MNAEQARQLDCHRPAPSGTVSFDPPPILSSPYYGHNTRTGESDSAPFLSFMLGLILDSLQAIIDDPPPSQSTFSRNYRWNVTEWIAFSAWLSKRASCLSGFLPGTGPCCGSCWDDPPGKTHLHKMHFFLCPFVLYPLYRLLPGQFPLSRSWAPEKLAKIEFELFERSEFLNSRQLWGAQGRCP